MSSFKVALLQMATAGNQAANQEKAEKFCRQAGEQGADIALVPELWNIGYTGFDPEQSGARETWQEQAIGADDPFVTHFQDLARELKMAIGITYLEKWPGMPRNSLTLFDRHGESVLTYAKVHTCDFQPELECATTPGSDFYVTPLDTAQGEVQMGAMICYDREFPESARILMLKGAEIILTPNACPLEINRLTQFRARAYENMVGVAMTNYAAPDHNGHSVAYDGIAFNRDESARDMMVIEADESEGVFMAEFDLEQLRAYREREIWGNAYRKPHIYALLTATEVAPPFIRSDSRRNPI
jgi:N-carbamoylputrescine amidase